VKTPNAKPPQIGEEILLSTTWSGPDAADALEDVDRLLKKVEVGKYREVCLELEGQHARVTIRAKGVTVILAVGFDAIGQAKSLSLDAREDLDALTSKTVFWMARGAVGMEVWNAQG
jgi:hypothetical protein